MSGFNFNFNLENFGLGLATGWASAYALYRARHILGAARESVSAQASSAQEYATRTADSRYTNDLAKFCQSHHLAGRALSLTDILVEPRFIPLPELAAPPEDDVIRSVFHVVPTVPDHPYLHAPYNIETMSIEALGRGDRAVALLGLPGSGRTTALLTIALWSLGHVRFDPPTDKVLERLEGEESEMNSDERAARQRERQQIHQVLGRTAGLRPDSDSEETSEVRMRASVFKQLTPIYVHLGNINPNLREFGRNVDPAEPLVRAVQHYCSRVTAKTIPRNVYERLNQGRVLLLLDGFDDLPSKHQPRILAWLEAFLDQYRENFIIVAGPARGYGALVDAGLTPVFMRHWNDVSSEQLIEKWAESWGKVVRQRGITSAGETQVEQAKFDRRGLSPFELTVKTWGTFADPDQGDIESWLRTMLAHYLPNEPMGTILPRMIQAAALQLEEGYISANGLVQFAAGQPIEEFEEPDQIEDSVFSEELFDTAAADDDVDSLFDADNGEDPFADVEGDSELVLSKADLKKQETEEKQVSRQEKPREKPSKDTRAEKVYSRLISRLHNAGLLTHYRGDRYQFVHPLIAAYLGSLALREMSAGEQMVKFLQPAWQQAFMFAAIHTELDTVVQARLDEPTDVLHSQLLDMARWLAFSEDRATWRTELYKRLGNQFVAPSQFTQTRERIAAALVGTRDPAVARVFRRALQHPNADVRRLACLGLGTLRDEESLNDMMTLATNQEQMDVAIAAILAVGAIGTDLALEELVITLSSGAEPLRYAAAESFALLPEEGYPVLYDGIHHQDLMLRRAAVFGLRRVGTPWALVEIQRAALADPQHYVRFAAEIAIQELQTGHFASGAHRYPDTENIPWLRDWIIEQLQTTDGQPPQEAPEDANEFLLKILDEGEPELQVLAVTTIGQLGLVEYTSVLYSALQHPNSAVREAALRSLSVLQMHLGRALPSPI